MVKAKLANYSWKDVADETGYHQHSSVPACAERKKNDDEKAKDDKKGY